MGALQSRRVEPRARRGEGADPRSLPASSGRAAAASARRESPEGGSFAVSAQASGRRGAEEAERRARDQQELLNGDPEEGPPWESRSPLEVAQTAEKTEGAAPLPRVEDRGGPVAGEGLGRRRLSVRVLRCDVSVEGGSRQEWTLTLYDLDSSGKVTREDVSSLMHTVCEVVNASISHSPDSSKTLHVTLTVSPKPSGEDRPPSGQGEALGSTQEGFQEVVFCLGSTGSVETSPPSSPLPRQPPPTLRCPSCTLAPTTPQAGLVPAGLQAVWLGSEWTHGWTVSGHVAGQ
ncbi:protein naked cuticle homolog 2 [Oryctolagus cuniculus]|uniref:protein naked cuticle homolog 2 n=1 Tax=Oryctolagus cuniculus TaxID=9986 RepID=UPI003879973C